MQVHMQKNYYHSNNNDEMNEIRKQINLLRVKNFLCENIKNDFKEIEFLCHNTQFTDSTPKSSQKALYNDLKLLQKKSDYGILPYMQDFSDERHDQISLAVIILDKQNEKILEKNIMDLAKKHSVEFDLYNTKTEPQVNSIVKGNYDNLMDV